MKWSDIPFQPTARTLRQFAACWLAAFLFLGLSQYHFKHRPHLGLVLIGGALLLGIPGLLRPKWVRPIFVGWMVVAFPIGWIVSMLMLLLLYFAVFAPMGLLFRLIGRDVLVRRSTPGRETFWVLKRSAVDVRQYFRQY